MRRPNDLQNNIVKSILIELGKANLPIYENITSLVTGSPTDDIYRFIRAAKGFEIYVYENGEVDINGPLRSRSFEIPDFQSKEEIFEAVIEEIGLQSRPEQVPDVLYAKLRERRKRSLRILFVGLMVFAVVLYKSCVRSS